MKHIIKNIIKNIVRNIRRIILRVFCFSFFSFLFFVSIPSPASELAYVKTDSPRDTMETFMAAMNDYRQGILEDSQNKKERILDAIRCFSEKNTNVISSQREKEMAAIFLKEMIDRVLLIDFSKIPENISDHRWRLKNTEIVLKPEKEGERDGEWLITESSWKRARNFYQRIKDRPYIEGSGQGALYSQPWLEAYLPHWFKKESFSLKNWQWMGLLLGVFLGLFIKFLTEVLTGFYRRFNFIKKQNWKTEFMEQMEKPLGLFMASLFWYGWIRYLKLEGLAFGITNGLIQIGFGVAITWAVYCSVDIFGVFFRKKMNKKESLLGNQLIPFLEKALKIAVILFGFLVVLQNMGVNVFSLLAGLGLGGLAFALAAKDTVANLFGSLMILADIPFKIGDWVLVDGVEGTVEDIGFRSTRIRTFYNSLVTIPNANMANAQIDNMGKRSYRRVSTHLDIEYNTSREKIENFVTGIREIIQKHPSTRKDSYHVYFSGYGESSLKIMLYFFFIADDWGEELKSKQDVYFKIFDLAHKLDIEFAYPTRTLYLNRTDPSAQSLENF